MKRKRNKDASLALIPTGQETDEFMTGVSHHGGIFAKAIYRRQSKSGGTETWT